MRVGSVLATLAVVGGAAAFWRMECRGRSGLGRIDPMASPDEVSQHAHIISWLVRYVPQPAMMSSLQIFGLCHPRSRIRLTHISEIIHLREACRTTEQQLMMFVPSGFSESAQYDDLIFANCTSCAVTQDKSAYWTPAAYFHHANGSYELVPQIGGMLA